MTSEWFAWSGSSEPCLNLPLVERIGNVRVGRYGGRAEAGADRNEDGLLLMRDRDSAWELAVIADAHDSGESADLVLNAIAGIREELRAIMRSGGAGTIFRNLETRFHGLFRDEAFLSRCRSVRGECSCLIVCRIGRYVWWHSVGDCMLFVLHPDLEALGQTLQNQRNYYEWIGRENTFDDEAPCYATGTRRLRPGRSLVVLATDGFVDPKVDPAVEPKAWLAQASLDAAVERLMQHLHEARTRDSTTLLAWTVTTE